MAASANICQMNEVSREKPEETSSTGSAGWKVPQEDTHMISNTDVEGHRERPGLSLAFVWLVDVSLSLSDRQILSKKVRRWTVLH